MRISVKNPNVSIWLAVTACALMVMTMLTGCGGKGSSHSPIAVVPPGTGGQPLSSAKITATTDKSAAFIYEGAARVELKCTANQAVAAMAGRCSGTESWGALSPDGTMDCNYNAVGEYMPACQADGEVDTTNDTIVIQDFYKGTNYEISEKTKPVDLMDYLSEPTIATGTITFTTTDPSKVKFQTGDIMMSTGSSECRESAEGGVEGDCAQGFFKKVVSVQVSGNTVIVQTEDATLTEIIKNADIEETVDLSKLSAGRSMDASGRVVNLSFDYDFSPNFETYLKSDKKLLGDSTAGAALRAGSGVAFLPEVTIKWHSTSFVVTEFYFFVGGEIKVIADIDFKATAGLDLTLEKTLLTYTTPPIVFIGPVPVSLNLTFKAGLTGKAQMTGYFTTGFDARIAAGLGFEYDGEWHNLSKFESEFNSHTPQFGASGDLSAEAYLKLEAGLLAGGVAGPSASGKAFVGTGAGYSNNYGMYYDAFYGLRFDVGFKITLWDILTFSWTKNLWNKYEYLAYSPLNIVPNLDPEGGDIVDGSFSTTLTCDVSGRPYSEVMGVKARCDETGSWDDITPGSMTSPEKICEYTTAGTHNPGCMVLWRNTKGFTLDTIVDAEKVVESRPIFVATPMESFLFKILGYQGNVVELGWTEYTMPDFESYKIYRSRVPGSLSQEDAELVGVITDRTTTTTYDYFSK